MSTLFRFFSELWAQAMGVGISKLEHHDDPKPYIDTIGRPISSSIFDTIAYEANEANDGDDVCIFPIELIHICMEYIGFLMYSTILDSNKKQSILYELLLLHHNNKNIVGSPLSKKHHVTYFDLLYRASIHGLNGKHNNHHLLEKCQDKSNLIILCHTNYDHIFGIYLHNPLIKKDNESYGMQRWSKYKDYNTCLMLLQSQFIYGNLEINKELTNRKCPRIIQVKPDGNIENALFRTTYMCPTK
eukprot:UN03240